MQAIAHLRSEERLGLLIALLAHVAVVMVLAFQALGGSAPVEMPERITVSLAEEVALEATAPRISTEPQEAPPPPAVAPPPPKPRPTPQQTRNPRVVQKPPPPTQRPRESQVNNWNVEDLGQREQQAAPPATKIGAAEQASLQQAIARQLRPHWKPPSGAGAEDLVTILAFDLNPDGSLNGRPRVVRQVGLTDANRPQARRHQELAIRAVQLAEPFDLPPNLYNGWKRISNWRFDWKSAQ